MLFRLSSSKEATGQTAEERFAVATQFQLTWWRFRRHKLAVAAGIVVILFYLVVIFADDVTQTWKQVIYWGRDEGDARAGVAAERLLKRLQKEQINLAMVRTRATSADDPELVRQRALCASLRDGLLAIPGAAMAGTRRGG